MALVIAVRILHRDDHDRQIINDSLLALAKRLSRVLRHGARRIAVAYSPGLV